MIYTSDNGFSLGHNGIWGHGAAAFPASAHRPSYHIPLIISGGSVVENTVNTGLVSQIDLCPTLTAIGGIADARPSRPSNARDLGGALRGEDEISSDAVFYEQEETRAIRTKDWLYAMRFKGAGSFPMQDELYDLKADPQEKKNLFSVPEYDDVSEDLRNRISEFFTTYQHADYDLWKGGSAKSNVTFDRLWKDAWGADWCAEFSGPS